MGKCMTRPRLDKSSMIDPVSQPRQIKRRTSSITQNQQFDSQLPNKKQMQYWNRRHKKICGTSNEYISQRQMRELFNYLQLDKETIKKLHEIFKMDKQILHKQYFFEGLKRFSTSNIIQLSQILYNMYFDTMQRSIVLIQRFQKQCSRYLRGYSSQQNNLKSSTKTTQSIPIQIKLKQLSTLLDQRKNIQDRKYIQRWLIKNINFHKFKYQFLEGGLIQDQKQAYKQFWIDYSIQSRINPYKSNIINSTNKNGQLIIMNWRWCQRMLRYMNQRYQIKGVPKLTRRPTIDAQSVLWNNKMRRKESIDMMLVHRSSVQGNQINRLSNNSNANNVNNNNMNGGNIGLNINTKPTLITTQNSSSTYNPYTSLTSTITQYNSPTQPHSHTQIQVLQKQSSQIIYKQSKMYPQQIDNTYLIGNFSWQLKRNIRKDVDYVTLKQQTYNKLYMIFGGGPKIKRKTIQGYIELRPYFILSYLFTYQSNNSNLNTNMMLSQEQLHRLSSSQIIANVLPDKTKNNICYHKNIGGEWQKFPQNPQQRSKKLIDTYTQTSFLIYMSYNTQKYFLKIFTDKTNKPHLGDMYQSKTYKIIDVDRIVLKQNTISQPIQVCILNQQQNGYIKFVVLNWAYHIERRIEVKEFNQHFKYVKSNILDVGMGVGVGDKKNRAGISNMGNTCYMNASLQAVLSSCKDQYLMSPKGQLGIQLRQIARKIRQKKKSVFPVDFKTVFDKHFQYFRGQDQHDAHQFCLHLFSQFQIDNKQLIQKILELKIKQTNRCTSCKKLQQIIVPNFMVQLPLRDFQKKQVKIDYITDNKNIQTIIFTIQDNNNNKVKDWKYNFQKVSGAKQYYLCQVQNSSIIRTFNKQDKLDNQLFKDLRIQNQFLITAYQTKLHKSNLKLQKYYNFKTYKDNKGNSYIARIEQDLSLISSNQGQTSNGDKSLRDINTSIDDTKKIKIRIQTGLQIQQKLVRQDQLYQFPQAYPQRQTYVKIINYDSLYNEKIGRPFIFKFLSHYPISAVRQALQECIGKKGYILRASPINQYSRCQVCKRSNQYSSDCFIGRQNFSPICWVQGRIDFVAAWHDANQYNSIIKRIKYIPINDKNNQIKNNQQQYDNFQSCLKKSQQIQLVTLQKCDFCQKRNIEFEHRQQIYRWPQVLIIHLKRFTVKNGQVTKIHTKWKLQEILYINKYKYILKAVLCHIGNSADYGHYITVAGGARYDDQLVTRMEYGQIPPQQVYMLFYNREG